MKKISIILSVLILLLATQPARSQAGKLFDIDHLQSGVFINQLYVDKEGFLWALTSNGALQYDGYKFKTFKKGVENSSGLGSSGFLSMVQDCNGIFYFGFYGHMQTYDGTAFRDVTKYDTAGEVIYCTVNCLFERSNGDIIAGTSTHGLLLVKDVCSAFQMAIDLQGSGEIRGLVEDSTGNLWIAAENGVYRYDGKDVRQYMDGRDGTKYYCICTDIADNIYVGTANKGLFCKQGELFIHVKATGNAPVPALYRDNSGNILVGFDGKGVAVYNPLTKELAENIYYSHEVELSKSKVYSIIEDKSGNIWLGLSEKGIFQQPPVASGFRYMGYKAGASNLIGTSNICCVFTDSRNNTWLGADKDGIYCLDDHGNLVRHYYEGVPSTVLTICEDESGHIWIGSYGEGGGWIDPRTSIYHPINNDSYGYFSITDYVADAEGRIWAGTMGNGLLLIDRKGNVARQFRSGDGDGLSQDFIPQLALSEDGHRLYVATSYGLNCLDLEDMRWNGIFDGNCLLPGANVSVVREYNGVLWTGTTDGLFYYDLRRRETKKYTVGDGLPSNNIASIEKDHNGQLWIGTDMGLSCMNVKNGTFRNHYVDDGLQSNYFTTGASWAKPDGSLLFGGTGGITWFNPADIDLREWKAEVRLTSFNVNGEEMIPQSGRFDLAYQDNSFSLSFSTLTFDTPERISYRYSINDDPFITLQGGNEMTFSRLSPGTYHFRIIAVCKGYETPEYSFMVVVHPPWYRSWWAWLIYSSLAGLSVWMYWEYRRRRLEERMQLQEHIHAEQLSEAKLRFFMNFSHDIRTPMTLIVTPLMSLIKNEDDPERKSIYETMRRNAERILGLVNQMMDLHKIDKGQMQMHMRETDLVGFIQDLYKLFEHQARSRQIDFVYEHSDGKLPIWIDLRHFDKVIVNLLSNAFKFTHTGGKIAIILSQDDANAVITVRDDGESIPEGQLEHIFERFYQSDCKDRNQQSGTGIGLDLTRSIVELHYGTITARNLDEGCEFIISLPLGNEHLSSEELMLPDIGDITDELTLTEPDVNDEPYPHIVKSGRAHPSVLIAEDDEQIRNYLVQELEDDYEVKAFADGQQAFKEAVRNAPDLVLSDVMMPEMDGITLCSKLRSNPDTSHLPIILLTAKNLDDDRLKGLATGADAYVIKPFNMDILRQTISNLIQKTRTMRLKYGHTDLVSAVADPQSVKSHDEKLLDNIMTVIDRNLSDETLTIDRLASEVGLSRVHLYRKMKDITGQAPHDFIRQMRLKKAAELLASGKMTVYEVTYACGFSSTTSFSALFKKFYGIAPSRYYRK